MSDNWRVLTTAYLDGVRQGETEDLDTPENRRTYREAYDLQCVFMAHTIARYGRETSAEVVVTVSPFGEEFAVRRADGRTRYITLVDVSS